MSGPVRLLVLGESQRGDDGAPAAAVRLLRRSALRGVDVRRCPALEVDALLDGGPFVIVDAVRGPEPGTIVEQPLSAVATLPADPSGSTHALPLPAVLTLAAALRRRPLEGRFVGVAGERFGWGQDLSPAVRAALPALAASIDRALAGEVERCA